MRGVRGVSLGNWQGRIGIKRVGCRLWDFGDGVYTDKMYSGHNWQLEVTVAVCNVYRRWVRDIFKQEIRMLLKTKTR